MPPQLLNRPTTHQATEDRSETHPSGRSAAETAALLLNQRVRFEVRRVPACALPAQKPARDPLQRRLLVGGLWAWGQIARRPSLLVAVLVGAVLMVVLMLPSLVLETPVTRTETRTRTTGQPTTSLSGPDFAVYQGGASEPIRFVVNRATNVLAAVPGGLL